MAPDDFRIIRTSASSNASSCTSRSMSLRWRDTITEKYNDTITTKNVSVSSSKAGG